MIKYGCMALVAMACSAFAPAANADGNFFVAGQMGQAKYDDSGLADDSADTRAFSAGYRWQAGPVVQIGIEGGFGSVDEIAEDYHYSDGTYVEDFRSSMEADYRHIGANARFTFGEGSRWFAIARGGYMAYDMDGSVRGRAFWDGQVIATYDESYTSDGGGAYFGGGIGVDITPNFNVNVMYNAYAYSDFEDDDYEEDIGTASTTTVGVEVRF